EQRRLDAWSTWQSLATKFRDAAAALRDGSALMQYQVTGGTSGTTGRTLLTATASAGATPGHFDVEVLDLARANKVSGGVFASASAALGIAGEFVVNGRSITVTAADSLNTLRDKINLASGGNGMGVTASVLSTGPQQFRLVLTAAHTGAGGIEFVDDAAGTLQALGFVDGSTTLNLAPGGAVHSHRVSSTTAAIAAALGVTLPPPSTINVGGRVITVGLTVDSLSSIAAKILVAGGTATLVAETVRGVATPR